MPDHLREAILSAAIALEEMVGAELLPWADSGAPHDVTIEGARDIAARLRTELQRIDAHAAPRLHPDGSPCFAPDND